MQVRQWQTEKHGMGWCPHGKESEPTQYKHLGNRNGQDIKKDAKCHGNDGREAEMVSGMALDGLKETRILRAGHEICEHGHGERRAVDREEEAGIREKI